MLLEITTTHQPATDLGYLLHKHPDKLQTIDLSVGKAQIFYIQASEEICSACLLLDINPLELVRNDKGPNAYLQQHYVNDRPYTSNSFLSSAIVKAFGSAINGTCHTKPELTTTPLPLRVRVSALKVDADKAYLHRLFEPLGYGLSYEVLPLDEAFPAWGESKYVHLTLQHTLPLKDLLSQLYVLMMALDNDRHYWINRNDIGVLLRRGEGWLDTHPEKEWITKRYLKNIRNLTSEALLRLAGEEELLEEPEPSPVRVSLHQQRLNQALVFLKASGAQGVLDLGCGEGKLLKMLLKEGQFKKIAGMDVSFSELLKARENLYLDEASPAMRERISVFQGSVTYKDERLKGYEAAALIEVIEHLDEERLPTMEKAIFGYAQPGTVVLSTPNAEYNQLFEKLEADTFRHQDHRFEWSRRQFADWCRQVAQTYGYQVSIHPVGPEDDRVGAPSQMAVFNKSV